MNNKYELEFLLGSHKGSFKNKNEILNYKECGCFYCKKIFFSSEIVDWNKENDAEETAICPKCGIDSVLSEKYPISDNLFLIEMYKYWF
ncbi:cytoplasmic protein [Chryseobacterium camelliae]|uniref:Cytoplasmic protein n=1 Tax=Chryseobacterium camelliae TaxID=1265445 RepID=A0ABY7QM97_9FLAO|nr:cytoplasmic protein [Chryseobacterium camelliae]WBV60141.1 cytoplasmic protein [Chryseobacterium camelliae]